MTNSWNLLGHDFAVAALQRDIQDDRLRHAYLIAGSAGLGKRTRPLRPDWEEVKDNVMRKAVLRKFESHADIRTVLLATGEEEIVENAPGDYYWGCGQDGSGQNKLGRMLMEVRTLLRECEKTE